MAAMPPEIQNICDNLSGFQKTYCEYRSKGLTQALSAEKSGSEAKDRMTLGSVGAQIERIPGVKEYIAYLIQERARITPIDELEIIQKLRIVHSECMLAGNFHQANKALELMGSIIGLFGGAKTGSKQKPETVNAFKDEGVEVNGTNDRILKLQSMMKDLNR